MKLTLKHEYIYNVIVFGTVALPKSLMEHSWF